MGALCYADDLVLISPSRVALQEQVNKCILYSNKYKVSFNKNKSVAIKFGNNCNNVPIPIKLLGEELLWKSKVVHLGNTLTSSCSDDIDIDIKIGQLYGQVNKIIANFRSCNVPILFLFKSYCSSFHGCQAWMLNANAIKKVETAWNKAVRRLLGLPFCTHRYLLPHLVGQLPILSQLCNRYMKLLFTMIDVEFDNQTIRNFARRSVSESKSCIGTNLLFINNMFKVDMHSETYSSVRHKLAISSLELNVKQHVTVNAITEFTEYDSVLNADERWRSFYAITDISVNA